MEQLFEGKEALGRELFLDGLKGIQILEQFLRSEFEVSQLDLRELSLTLNRVLCELVVAIVGWVLVGWGYPVVLQIRVTNSD